MPQLYKPSLLFKNGHFNTIYPSLLRKQRSLAFVRKKVITPDDDFLDVDFLQKGNRRIVILCHGLEGSSGSHYIIGTSGILSENGWDIAAINYRGCSGVMNKQLRMYHSGATDDLDTVISSLTSNYEEIALVGFSLGGNLVLKYCGERGTNLSTKIMACVGVSVPTDLHAGSLNISKRSNYIYEKKFMESLSLKVIAKHKQFPSSIDLSLLKGMKKLFDFDDKFTGPLHGFKNAIDYYTKCSSKSFLSNLALPTLIINALDDPFLPAECYPHIESENNRHIELLTPRNGGHVGFSGYRKKYYWNEIKITEFLNDKSG